jgi:hypothetical protein
MSQPLDSDMLDDLAEPPEGPAYHAGDEGDFGDLGGPLDADLLDGGDGIEFDGADATDELESAVAEALSADDADEFNFGGFLKKLAPVVSCISSNLS